MLLCIQKVDADSPFTSILRSTHAQWLINKVNSFVSVFLFSSVAYYCNEQVINLP